MISTEQYNSASPTSCGRTTTARRDLADERHEPVVGANVGSNPGPGWHVKRSGDFNGDGKSDILWQNDDGTAAIWLMNGTSLVGGSRCRPNPGPTWHVKDAGDFNGDGKADILWQNATARPRSG